MSMQIIGPFIGAIWFQICFQVVNPDKIT